jgi:hypothetical protein
MRRALHREGFVARPVTPISSPTDWIYRLRTHDWYRRSFHFLSHHFLPNVFGIALLLLIAVVLPLRLVFELRSRAGLLPASTCRQSTPLRAPGETETFALWPSLTCNATGVQVVKGETYRVDIALPTACAADRRTADARRRTGAWADRSVPVADLRGFSSLEAPGPAWQRAAFMLALPLRREPGANWFAVIAQIGTTTPTRVPLQGQTLVAGHDGPLSLYVNDAIVPCLAWDCLYRNNAGGPARVRIVRMPAGGPPPPALAPYDCTEQATVPRHTASS